MIAVVIPYFKAPTALARCMAALQASSYSDLSFFVRDNSLDNVFYTRAINEGLTKYLGDPRVDFALILNQDAYVFPDTLQVLIDHMAANPHCGIACPLQVKANGRSVTWGGSFEAFPFGRHRADPIETYTAPFDTYWANGAAMLVRMSMLRQIGLMDENMRFVGSDADLSFTARARGWQVTVVPTARVEHFVSSSKSRDAKDAELDKVKIADALYFMRKWVSGDLYRGLAFEGPHLKEAGVRVVINKFQDALNALNEAAAARSEDLAVSG